MIKYPSDIDSVESFIEHCTELGIELDTDLLERVLESASYFELANSEYGKIVFRISLFDAKGMQEMQQVLGHIRAGFHDTGEPRRDGAYLTVSFDASKLRILSAQSDDGTAVAVDAEQFEELDEPVREFLATAHSSGFGEAMLALLDHIDAEKEQAMEFKEALATVVDECNDVKAALMDPNVADATVQQKIDAVKSTADDVLDE